MGREGSEIQTEKRWQCRQNISWEEFVKRKEKKN